MRNQDGLKPFLLFSFAVVLFVFFINRSLENHSLRKDLLEAGLALTVLGLFFRIREVQEFWNQTPRPHRVIMTVLFFLVTAGHLIDKPRTMFPFVGWTMYGYTVSNRPVVAYECVGVTDEGKEIPVRAGHLFPTLRTHRISEKMRELVKNLKPVVPASNNVHQPSRLERVWPEMNEALYRSGYPVRLFFRPRTRIARETPEKQLDLFLESIGRRHNDLNPQERIRSIQLMEKTIHINGQQKTVERRLIASVYL